MASFNAFIPLLAEAEGGYQNHTSDRGNYNSLGELAGTNWGISAQTLEAWRGYSVSATDMRNLTKSEADEIYKTWFWDSVKADKIADQALANILVDAKVNHPGTAVKLFQTALNVNGATLIVDGIFGNKTLGATNIADKAKVHNDYRESRSAWYQFRAAQLPESNGYAELFRSWRFQPDPSQAVFLNGWLNRLEHFPELPQPYTEPLAGMDLVAINQEKKSLH